MTRAIGYIPHRNRATRLTSAQPQPILPQTTHAIAWEPSFWSTAGLLRAIIIWACRVPQLIRMTKRLAYALGLSGLCLPSAASATGEAAATVGKWTLNVAESIPPQGKSFRPFTVEIREAGAILDFTQYESGKDGKIREFSHRTPTDGIARDVPGMAGAKMAMTLLPSGVIDAQFWFPNGALQNKICVLEPSLKRQKCLATITAPGGEVVFFKHVLDRVE